MENATHILFKRNREDDEHETWIEGTLAPVFACFENTEHYLEERIHDPRTVVDEFEIRSKVTSRLYLCQSVTSKTSRYKEKVIQAVHRQHDLEVARRKGRDGQRLSDPQA